LGADGVMIAGCHPGECHYLEQNYKTMRRFAMLKHTLKALGVEDARVRLQWASAAEGTRLANAINEMVEQVRALGPLNWKDNWVEEEDIDAALDRLVEEHAEAMEVPA
jgi:F420-non-reducing hydrogenase iron-sulfur subunit